MTLETELPFDPYDYPRRWEADVVLADGGTVHIRPITPDDAERLVTFHAGLSSRTVYFRFFGAYPRIPKRDLDRFTILDHHKRVALIALLGDDIIGVGRYETLKARQSAEVSLVVSDAHQGRGLGSILLEHLAAAAREHGLRRFEAEVLAENVGMVRVFRDAGYQISRELEDGVLHLEFAIEPNERSLAVARAREQAAEARSMHNVLHPRSVAVIGASTDHTKIGHAVLTNLLAADFHGPVYPVNAEHRSVRGVRAYPSVLDIPDQVDLAVVAVPAAGVDEVMDACLAKGVKALVVVSSGYAEAGESGDLAQRRLVAEARAHGMRVVGPNALGVVNRSPAVRLNATLAPMLPGPGRVGFFCQSGALGVAILAQAAERGLGLSTFVSAGNRADVSGNDLLQYWETDPATDVVLLYLESFGNPRKFARLARRLGRSKPVIVVKSGRYGVRRGLAANAAKMSESSVAALFEQAGAIRVDSIAQLFDAALVLAYQPLPTGDRVAIVGNSSALGVLAADAVISEGLTLAGDPVDVGSQTAPEEFAAAVRAAASRPDVDSLVAVFVPPLAIPGTAYARALREAVLEAGHDKPVVSTFLAAEGVPAELAVLDDQGMPGRGSIPSYPSPERAVVALARATRYQAWRAAPLGEFTDPSGIRGQDAHALMDELMTQHRRHGEPTQLLSPGQVSALLDCYGIRVHPAGEITDAVAADAISCVIGLQDDPSFGTLVSFGLAGVISELVGDLAYRAIPLSDVDVAELVQAPRAAPLLTGYRGGQPADIAALEDLVHRVAALAEDLPEVRSLTLDPVLATADGCLVTGATMTIGPQPSRSDGGPRRLG
ncbi:GNAT family N-acetyltransferase [Pseudonocardiaceae bacterium YIM PH 21723]|nr:GNAT family N-acetyltransferase [Pseudonocardiaceae bacterium YIM PH 21723]